MNMNAHLKAKYTAYNGDTQRGSDWKANGTQYGNGRSGNGNGKRPGKLLRQPEHPSNSVRTANDRVMVVNALTGHRVMVAV